MNPLKEAQASLPTERVEVRPGRVLAVHHRAGRVIHGRPGDVVIFVHGSCASLVHWRAQIEHFQAAGFAIVAYDFLGCGRSAKPHEQHCQNAPWLAVGRVATDRPTCPAASSRLGLHIALACVLQQASSSSPF